MRMHSDPSLEYRVDKHRFPSWHFDVFILPFFTPYLKPFVETPGGYWVLSREESKDVCMGTSLMPFSLLQSHGVKLTLT